MTVRYSAAANPNDPVLINAASILDPTFSGVYKTNFWDVARQACDPFYPGRVLPLFYPATANILDLGLPVPDVEQLHLGDGILAAVQQGMPGRLFPYSTTSGNAVQSFSQFIGTQPFFSTFTFGYTAPVNWFEAVGIPITTFDDFGRENAYPLIRVQAVAAAGNTLRYGGNGAGIAGRRHSGLGRGGLQGLSSRASGRRQRIRRVASEWSSGVH